MNQNERVKHLRKDILSLTLEEFGKKVGVSRGAVCAIENGKRALTSQMCKSISNAFDVYEEWLRTGEGKVFKSDPEDELGNFLSKYFPSESERKLAKIFLNLDPKARTVFLKAVEAYAEAYQGQTTSQPTE